MTSLTFQVLAWPTFAVALLVFGFAPGAALRLIVLAFVKGDPRRQELRAELYSVPRIERPFWVVEQLEVALFDGLYSRFTVRRARKGIERYLSDDWGLIVTSEALYVARRCESGSYLTDTSADWPTVKRVALYVLRHPSNDMRTKELIRAALARDTPPARALPAEVPDFFCDPLS